MLRGRSVSLVAALTCALGIAGTGACDAPETSAPPAAEPGELPARSRELPIAKAVDVRRAVWPARTAVDAGTRARLTTTAQAAIDGSHLPVLVPRDAGLTERVKLVVRDNFYAASARVGDSGPAGVTVNVSATRITHRYANIPNVKAPERVRADRPAFVTQNEGIWSVTFVENGLSYVVEVECDRPGEDARCKDAAFVRRVADDLAFVGGSFEQGAER